jgi:hypothetical protein
MEREGIFMATAISREELVEAVSEELFVEPETRVYAVLDGASVTRLLDRLYGLSPVFGCLFRGELTPDMAEVAPYLVQLEPGSEFTIWLIRQGWGNHWGIFIRSEADFRAMRRHLRSLLIVNEAASGRPLRFRYYDPRVLRLFLPACKGEELAALFGPAGEFLLESEDPNIALRLQRSGGGLSQESIDLGGH